VLTPNGHLSQEGGYQLRRWRDSKVVIGQFDWLLEKAFGAHRIVNEGLNAGEVSCGGQSEVRGGMVGNAVGLAGQGRVSHVKILYTCPIVGHVHLHSVVLWER